jgi:hypothetical protein
VAAKKYGFVNLPDDISETNKSRFKKLEPFLVEHKVRAWHKKDKDSPFYSTNFSLLIPSPADKIQFPRIVGEMRSTYAYQCILHELGHWFIYLTAIETGRENELKRRLSRSEVYRLQEELEAWAKGLEIHRVYFPKVKVNWNNVGTLIVRCLETYVPESKEN